MTTTPTPDPLETILDEWLVHDEYCNKSMFDDPTDCTCIVKDIKRNLMPALTAHIKAVCEEQKEAEHYYSHKGRLQAGYAELYFCACGKHDKSYDRLLRHIAWQEKRLESLTKEEQS